MFVKDDETRESETCLLMRSSSLRPPRTSPSAFAQPMPDCVSPMLATLTTTLPPNQEQFAFEFKWDGVRTVSYFDRGDFKLLTRNRIEATRRYPELRALAEALANRRAILDGEIVALDNVDRPSFFRLQR